MSKTIIQYNLRTNSSLVVRPNINYCHLIQNGKKVGKGRTPNSAGRIIFDSKVPNIGPKLNSLIVIIRLNERSKKRGRLNYGEEKKMERSDQFEEVKAHRP